MRRLTLLVAAVAAAALVWFLAVPAIANHYGWATRWPLRMPGTIHFRGRAYGHPGGCVAKSHTPFVAHRAVRVGAVSVVIGADIPILESEPSRHGPADVALATQPSGNCYIVYSLEGGP